ncbi:MAG: phosphatidylglycerol lysyltransferase domain-containing protein, partial [Candidatus Adiutrix sp.]|nr:phosphatidylglycerol lysyltransferase domain-containing protein [Candidatus Adiutrix sp.]
CRRVPEALVEMLRSAGRPYEIAPDRDNDEYVYLREQLASLSGRRMHQKKNHYNYFVSHNRFECLPLTAELRPELLAVQEGWLATKVERDDLAPGHLRHEAESVREILEHLQELDQLGLAIRINGRIEGFTLGEVVGPDTVQVHLEKANPDIRGLFVALASHFCRDLPPAITYVNREQDLGLPGLRQAKESLKPDHMIRKFTVTPAGAGQN